MMEVYIDSSRKVDKIRIFTLIVFVILLSLISYLNIDSRDYNRATYLKPIVRKLCQDRKSKYVNNKPVGRFSIQPHTGLLVCRTAKHGSSSLANIFLKIYER